MDTLTGRPSLLKQANLSLIRRVLKANTTATRAEIARATRISSTTVRSLLSEMASNGEIESIGLDESSGGRKAERYRFAPDRYFGAAFCLMENQVHALLVGVCGEIVEETRLDVRDGRYEDALVAFLDDLTSTREIKAIGLGVSGVAEGGSFFRKDLADGELHRVDIGSALAARYGLPVVMENDLNATAIGFSRCYKKEFPAEAAEEINMAYLYFEEVCVSAGFIAGGRIIRGSHCFAGELGLVPVGGDALLDDLMAQPMDDAQYTDRVIQIIGWVCGILNPQYVLLGGPGFRKRCLGPIGDGLSALLPERMFAEILFSQDGTRDYHDGMAYLTAGKMFDEVQFIKEP